MQRVLTECIVMAPPSPNRRFAAPWLVLLTGIISAIAVSSQSHGAPVTSQPSSAVMAQPSIERARAELLASADAYAKSQPPHAWDEPLMLLVDTQPSQENKAAVRVMIGKYLAARQPATLPAHLLAERYRHAAYCLAFIGDLEEAKRWSDKARAIVRSPATTAPATAQASSAPIGDVVGEELLARLGESDTVVIPASAGTLCITAMFLEQSGQHDDAVRTAHEAQAMLSKSKGFASCDHAQVAQAAGGGGRR